MPLEVVVNKLKEIASDQTKLIITTPVVTGASASAGAAPQKGLSRNRRKASQKRRRSLEVGEFNFPNMQEVNLFFRVGKIKAEVSPCVVQEKLDVQYPIVYEEWQRHRMSNDHAGVRNYRCRRQRGRRTKKRGASVENDSRRRKPDQKVKLIGCDCPARYKSQVMPDGSVKVKFFGYHNHDVQKEYAVRFLNPILTCFRIREIVDSKLLAGVIKLHSIFTGVLSEMFKYRQNKSKSDPEILRCYHMAFALTKQQIRNRRDQLGLNLDQLAHK